MNGMSAGFQAAMGALGDTAGRDSRGGFLMLDPSSGVARLRMKDFSGAQRTATVTRWLAIVRAGHRAGSIPATRVIWLLDADSATWPGGRTPGELARGADGPVLWFHARGGRNAPRLAVPSPLQRVRRSWRRRLLAAPRLLLTRPPLAAFRWLRAGLRRARSPWMFTTAGILGTAGVVDGASARVSRWPLARRLRLRTDIDTAMWELSGTAAPDTEDEPLPGARLTISASGRPRELDLDVLRQWL